jgi:hypothetical protein
MKIRNIARAVTVTLMGLAVLVATGDGFAQSYSGLYGWGLEHGLMGLFLIAIDGHRLRKTLLSWVDLLLPASIAAAGWTASLVFNVGHVKVHDFATEATAAVPPLASMIGLLVLLRTLHRYVTHTDAPAEAAALMLATSPEDLALGEALDDTPEALMAWLKGEDVPAVPDADQVRAAEIFADEVQRGKKPGIKRIQKALRIGQDKAYEVQAYLSVLANQ